MKIARFFGASIGLILGLGAAQAADAPGSKDPSGFKRYEGSEIIGYATSPYDRYLMARGAGGEGGFLKSEAVEGAITRVIYRVPKGHTSLELLRNYERMLAEAGFTQTFELANSGMSVYDSEWFNSQFYSQPLAAGTFRGDAGSPFAVSIYGHGQASTNPAYVTAKATKDGQDMTVAVLVVESGGFPWKKPNTKDPVVINPGEVIVGLDLVIAKAAEIKMVEVKAVDMADALATKGSIDLYGIYFDVDKIDIKPDSSKTLDEVANLLKIDRSLKLEISGHTDSTGDKDHNMKLSEGRAAAVVDALVKKYNIDTGRLRAKGYGDTKPVAANDTDVNKAKNRRVELVKMN